MPELPPVIMATRPVNASMMPPQSLLAVTVVPWRGKRKRDAFASAPDDSLLWHQFTRRKNMAKTYWISVYHKVHDEKALGEYGKLADPAIAAAGGRMLARGQAAHVYEKGIKQRVVIIEFDSMEKAVATHDSPGYQAALKALGNAVERDMRFVEGLA